MGRVHPCQLDGWSIISESLQLKHPTRPKQIHSSSSLSAKRQTIISQESRLYLVSRPNLVSRPVQFGLIKSTVFCSFPLYFTNRSCYICHIRLLYSTASLQTIPSIRLYSTAQTIYYRPYPNVFHRKDNNILLNFILHSRHVNPRNSTVFYFTILHSSPIVYIPFHSVLFYILLKLPSIILFHSIVFYNFLFYVLVTSNRIISIILSGRNQETCLGYFGRVSH